MISEEFENLQKKSSDLVHSQMQKRWVVWSNPKNFNAKFNDFWGIWELKKFENFQKSSDLVFIQMLNHPHKAAWSSSKTSFFFLEWFEPHALLPDMEEWAHDRVLPAFDLLT